MPKCYLHGSTIKETETTNKPLPEIPFHEKNNFQQNIALVLAPKSKERNPAVFPYRHWEFKEKDDQIRKLQELKQDLEETKQLFEEKNQQITELNQQITELNHKLNQQITELNHKLNQLITKILNISEKPTGTLTPN